MLVVDNHLSYALSGYLFNQDMYIRCTALRLYHLFKDNFDCWDINSLKKIDSVEKLKLFLEEKGNQNDLDSFNFNPKLFSAFSETIYRYLNK